MRRRARRRGGRTGRRTRRRRVPGCQGGVGGGPDGLNSPGEMNEDPCGNQRDQGREQAVFREVLPTILSPKGSQSYS